ncbi:replication initiator [Corynebacterium sp. UMB9976]|uniref:replication initiator n=1 Tax=Corynebacterium sp. UMB9976 TaxID=3046354 RepID=UPI0030146862
MSDVEAGEKRGRVRVGPCSRPVRVIDKDGRVQHVRCGSRRKKQCESCSYLAQGDYRRLLKAGYEELESSVGEYAFYLLTLTAPSFGAVHRVPKQGRSEVRCRCGKFHHADKDRGLRGVAVDLDSYRFDVAVQWNHNVGRLWNATNTRLKKLLPTMDYVKVSEWQLRGALHLHVILRIPRCDWHALVTAPGSHGGDVTQLIRQQVSDVVVDNRWRWGAKALDIREIKTGEDRKKAARYLAKALAYVTKDVSEDGEWARDWRAREHFDRLDGAARDMNCGQCSGGAMACGRLCHRRWGARSSTMSKSRGGVHRRGWCDLRKMDLVRTRREFAEKMTLLEQAQEQLDAVLRAESGGLWRMRSVDERVRG